MSPAQDRDRDRDRDKVTADFHDAVNMTPAELEEWLATDASHSVGQPRGDTDGGNAAESVGHASGRRIVDLLRTRKRDLSGDDLAHMRKVVGYVHRHQKQRPEGDVTDTPWRYSLMNWGHDPQK